MLFHKKEMFRICIFAKEVWTIVFNNAPLYLHLYIGITKKKKRRVKQLLDTKIEASKRNGYCKDLGIWRQDKRFVNLSDLCRIPYDYFLFFILCFPFHSWSIFATNTELLMQRNIHFRVILVLSRHWLYVLTISFLSFLWLFPSSRFFVCDLDSLKKFHPFRVIPVSYTHLVIPTPKHYC